MLFSKDKKEQVSLLIDIGNSTVTSALVLFKGEDLPVFLYKQSNYFSHSDKPDSVKLSDNLLNILESQMLNLVKNGFNHKYWKEKSKRIHGALISFSSPWFLLKTKHISISNEKPFVITEAFLKDVITKEEDLFRQELKDNGVDIIEKNIVHAKINGYTVGNIIGKKTQNIDAFLCMSAIENKLSEKIFAVISKHNHIPNKELFVRTFPLISFSIIRDLFTGSNDFLIMDVTGDVTDVTLVVDSVITQTISIPSGRNFIIRQISKSFDVSMEIAESMLHLYTKEKSDDSVAKKMGEIMESVEKEWAIYIENALTELSPTLSLPSNLYLMTENDVSIIYSEFMKLQKMDATASFRKGLNVVNIDETSLSKFFINESGSKVDEFIAIISLFYKKFLKEA